MKYQEKKYLVGSLPEIQKRLEGKGARKGERAITTHYYAQQEGNEVVKLVVFVEKNEIHILHELQGRYSLKEAIPMVNIKAGLQWLKNRGYQTVNIVKMDNTDYEYKNGIVGLYRIDDFLDSVILDFPDGQHEGIEKELGLQTAKVISVPYNKLLEQMGHLRSMKLN